MADSKTAEKKERKPRTPRAALPVRYTTGPHGLTGKTTVGTIRNLHVSIPSRVPDDREVSFADDYAEVAG